MKILNSLVLSFCLLFAFGIVLAQEATNVTSAVAQDENVTAQDLGVSESTILPDSPFYFFKNLGRTIQSAITFNPVKKAELREKFANEKLIELRKTAEKTEDAETIKKATENYQKEVEKVKEVVEKIKETAQENEQVSKFLDKFIQQQTLQRAILQKLETQVPEKALEKITEAREAHLEKFGEVMNKLENKEKIRERLETNLEQAEGSEFKKFKNLEMLEALEEKSPEAIKEAVQQVRVNVMTQLKEEVKEMTAEKLQQFQIYTENVGGSKEKQVEILDELRLEVKQLKPELEQNLIQTRERIMEQVRTKTQEINCPQVAKPVIGFCPNGKIRINKDEKSCITSYECLPLETEEVGACTTQYDPVCGKNGKTYSNSCFAKLAGVGVTQKGTCPATGQQIQTQTQIRTQLEELQQQLKQLQGQ